jgi:hypothetical protein
MCAEPGVKRLSVDEFHPQPGTSISHVGTVDGDDIRMTNLRERARFREEPLDGTELRDVAAQQFQRDVAIQL